MINDLIISQIRQRLEILYQMVDELEGGGGGGGTTNYNDLSNKPSIAGVQLTGNKTASDLGLATPSDITNAFAPSTITLAEGGTFPSSQRGLLADHKPINVNDDQYYFLEETGVDYLYGSMPTSGAYPSLSYLRIMKSSFAVEFHNTEIDTVPTEGSDNLITSGAVYDAVQGGGGGGDVDLTPVNIGSRVATFPEQYRYLLEKHLPFKFTSSYPYGSTWVGSWQVVSEDATNYICASLSPSGGSNSQTFYFAQFSVNKSTWAWSVIRPNNLSTILVSAQSDSYFYGNSNVGTISANSNLDSSIYGRYYCTAANAATLTNCPTTDAFQLLVYNATASGANEMIQQLTTVTAIPVVYRRVKTGGTWGSWYKFEGTVVS